MSSNVLLVEGDYDKEFLQAFCNLSLGKNKVIVEVLTPRELGANRDGWRSIIDNMPLQLKRLNTRNIDKLGIVLDADYLPNNSGGFEARYQLLTKELTSYKITNTPNYDKGDIFTGPDGMPNIGLWIMPSHRDDGMIEDFIETIVSSATDQQTLLSHASSTINSLPITLFNTKIHRTKAKIGTWLAWQKQPGKLIKALNDGILDRNKAANFELWLKNTFS